MEEKKKKRGWGGDGGGARFKRAVRLFFCVIVLSAGKNVLLECTEIISGG